MNWKSPLGENGAPSIRAIDMSQIRAIPPRRSRLIFCPPSPRVAAKLNTNRADAQYKDNRPLIDLYTDITNQRRNLLSSWEERLSGEHTGLRNY